MAADPAAASSPSADSYIGSLISLTSRSEIRYEGVLYNINTQESSIGLRNVRSFGTEGRKKDGPQIPASDKIYEYILFRGSDIKDLHVKSSPSVQTPSIHDDPAIIQSHYPHPASTSGSLPPSASHTVQSTLPRPTFQGSVPLYQPGGNLGSWGTTPAPPTGAGSGLAMPMYWQGFYAPPGGLPHLQPSSLLRSTPGLPIAQPIQQSLQYPGVNASLQSGSSNSAAFPPPLFPTVSSMSLTSTSFPLTVAPNQASLLAPETSSSLVPNIPPATSLSATTLPLTPPFTSSHEPLSVTSQNLPLISMPMTVPTPTLGYQTMFQSMPSVVGSSSSISVEPVVPLVTPDQLLQPAPPVSQPLQRSKIEVEVIKPQESDKKPYAPESQIPKVKEPILSVPESSVRAPAKVKEPILSAPKSSIRVPPMVKDPILPLPKPMHQKPNGAAMHTYHYNRGRGRGRGNGYAQPIMKFTEEFDFMAMNEKFNKDEVWGHLGKTNDKEGGENEDRADDIEDGGDGETHKPESKPVYVKDDFFDTLSSNSHNRDSQGGRIKFSEQLKLDAETFGDFPRHRPIRGGGGGGGGRGFRGGGRMRGSYPGRGYSYVPRGRGHSVPNRAS